MSTLEKQILSSKDVLRPAGALGSWLTGLMLAAAPNAFAVLRRMAPILKLGSLIVLSRYDDVREAFANDADFDTPYASNIEVLTGGIPFFLGMQDGPAYHDAVAAMRRLFKEEDLDRFGDEAERRSAAIVSAANGELEVVNNLVRKVTFDLYIDYIGIPQPKTDNLDVWATRLFEFQFSGSPKDKALRAEVDVLAPALRTHIDSAIADRKASTDTEDDVLGRCLKCQAADDTIFTNDFIRTNLLCMIVGGPPQVPMVVPQALEQLLRRPDALAQAGEAARANQDDRLWTIVQEAMRFDPLAPALPRVAVRTTKIACGLRRETEVKEGDNLILGFASAMRDPHRISYPEVFNPNRHEHEYIHFGHGLHECFGRFLNRATLHRILKPLLAQPNLRRARGRTGHLSKRKIFAEKLVVRF